MAMVVFGALCVWLLLGDRQDAASARGTTAPIGAAYVSVRVTIP